MRVALLLLILAVPAAQALPSVSPTVHLSEGSECGEMAWDDGGTSYQREWCTSHARGVDVRLVDGDATLAEAEASEASRRYESDSRQRSDGTTHEGGDWTNASQLTGVRAAVGGREAVVGSRCDSRVTTVGRSTDSPNGSWSGLSHRTERDCVTGLEVASIRAGQVSTCESGISSEGDAAGGTFEQDSACFEGAAAGDARAGTTRSCSSRHARQDDQQGDVIRSETQTTRRCEEGHVATAGGASVSAVEATGSDESCVSERTPDWEEETCERTTQPAERRVHARAPTGEERTVVVR